MEKENNSASGREAVTLDENISADQGQRKKQQVIFGGEQLARTHSLQFVFF